MRYTNPAPVEASPLRRLLLTIQLDPAKALICYCIAGIVLFAIVGAGMYEIMIRETSARNTDMKNAPIQTGVAIVQGKLPWDRSTKMNPADSGVSLDIRIGDKRALTLPIMDERTFAVRIGDQIRVKYCVGKSGAIYIEEWQPQPR